MGSPRGEAISAIQSPWVPTSQENTTTPTRKTRSPLTRSLQRVAAVLVELEKIRAAIGPNCSGLALQLDLVRQAVSLRRQLIQAISDSATQIKAAEEAVRSLATPANLPQPGAEIGARILHTSAPDLTRDLTSLAQELVKLIKLTSIAARVDLSSSPWKDINADIQKLSSDLRSGSAIRAANDLDKIWKDFQTAADTISRRTINGTVADIQSFANEVVTVTIQYERLLIGGILQVAVPIWDEILKKVAGSLKAVIEPFLLEIHKDVGNALGAVLTQIGTPGPSNSLLSNVIAGDTLKALQRAKDQVDRDRQHLIVISTACQLPDAIKLADQITALQLDWANSPPGLIQALQVVGNVVGAVATGHFANLFDISRLEDQLRDAVINLIPARVNLSYDFDTEVGNFPAGDPIFAMDRENFSSDGVEMGEIVRNDLDLRTRISVDLITGERSVSATGYIRPFRLHLLGSSLDLATIRFHGAKFSAAPGQKTTFNADIADAEIGEMLSFLQALQQYLSPSGHSGFYRDIQLVPPQIEVGYRFSKDFLPVGGLIFQNIALSMSAILPIDGRQAEFRFAFASRERPFMISAPPPTPFGGGGFVGLRANAKGVVAFEIQLEFGAIFGIEFGPLSATARITAGIYLLCQAGGRRVLEGFVQAVGEGNIACFSISVLIQIKTTQQADSSMSGSSVYAFSFKVSFCEIKYQVTAGYRTEGSRSQGRQVIEATPAVERATPARPPIRRVRTDVPSMQHDWKHYRAYVDI